jgi:hypothetical protein
MLVFRACAGFSVAVVVAIECGVNSLRRFMRTGRSSRTTAQPDKPGRPIALRRMLEVADL